MERIEYTPVIEVSASRKANGLKPYTILSDCLNEIITTDFRALLPNPMTVLWLTDRQAFEVTQLIAPHRQLITNLETQIQNIKELIEARAIEYTKTISSFQNS